MSLREGAPTPLQSALSTAQDLYVSLASCLCRPDATLALNGRRYKLLRMLGEGRSASQHITTSTL